MNKRIIILILSAIFTLCPISTYAADTQTNDELKFSLLQSPDIICGVNYDEALLEKEITKSSYINFIMNIASDKKYANFYDEESLQNAQSMGLIVSADGVGENDTLSLNEAVTIAVRLLGYELDAQNGGGYPNGYLSVANAHSLLDAVEYGDKITYSQAVKILYNITEADCSTYRLTEGGHLMNYSESVNALEFFRKIYRVKGIVTDNGESGLYTTSGITEDYVKIEKETYLKGNSGADKFLGHYVIAYVKEDDVTDEVMFIWDKTKSIIRIDAENVSSVTENLTVLKYYENEESTRLTSIEIKPEASFMLNGATYPDCTEADFKKEGTTIALIDHDGDEAYDVVNLESYDTIIVEAVSVSAKKIYNEYTFNADTKELDLSDYDDEDILIFQNGEKASLSDIETGDVLTVFKVPNGREGRIKIYIGTESVEGVVETYSESDSEIVVGSKTYEISDLYKKAREKNDSAAKAISVGTQYIFRMDKDGRIVFVIRGASDDITYAYLDKFTPSYDTGELIYYISLFTEEGVWENRALAEKVKVNGTTRNQEKADINGEITACVQKDIIGVKFNQKGEVSYIETPTDYYEGIDTSLLNRDTGVSGKTYRYNDTTFSNYYYMDGNTKVFIVPNDNTGDKSLYRIGTNYSFKSNSTPSGKLTGYNRDEYYNLDMVLWSSSTTNIKTVGTTLYMVKKKGVRANSDDEVVPYVNVASETYAGVSFDGEAHGSGLENADVGDVIQIHINSQGRIDNCELFYDLSSNDTTKKAVTGSLGGEDYAVQGFVRKKDVSEGMILVDTVSEIAFKLSPSKSVLIYDNETDEVRVGTINDIELDDFVVVNLTKNQTSMVAVYKGLQ